MKNLFNSMIMAAILAISMPGPAVSKDRINGVVVGVADGDTVSVWEDEKVYPVRLYGIDAPEIGQAYGPEAKLFISRLVFNKDLVVTIQGTDRDGNLYGLIHIDRVSVNEELIRHGMAWVDPKTCSRDLCSRWKQIQGEARAQGEGLWKQADPVPPWEF
mgnify:CR=1 FL=1